MKIRRKHAFTLIEVLIVVVILAVLAATIIPKFNDSTAEAQASNAKYNLHVLRSQIELYRAQHYGESPKLATIEDQLTKATDAAGGVSTAGEFGPYMQTLPVNPFNNEDTFVTAGSTLPPTAAAANGGWLYDEGTGQVWINHKDYLSQ